MFAPNYFAESISSELGFWGVKCDNYFDFIVGRCGKDDPGEDEDEGDEEEGSGDEALWDGKRLNGLPKVEPENPPRKVLQWQLMGEYCNERLV